MIKYYYICDYCGKRLETRKQQTPFGEIEIICGTAKTKEWDTTMLFQHLCRECALSIDDALLRLKMSYLGESKKVSKERENR